MNELVGIPWLDKGRTHEGCDCWGLVRLAFAEQLGVDLPSYADGYQDTGDRTALDGLYDSERGPWQAVELGTEEAFDMVLLRERPWHVGLVVRRGLMLHMPEGQSSVVEPYTTGRHLRRIEGIYRHVSKAVQSA